MSTLACATKAGGRSSSRITKPSRRNRRSCSASAPVMRPSEAQPSTRASASGASTQARQRCCASRYIAASQSPRNATGTPADSSASRTSAATGPSFLTVRTTSDSCVPLGREAQVGAHQSSHNTLVDPVRRQRFDSPHGPFLLPFRMASQVPLHGREDGAPSPSGPSSPDLRPTPTPRLG